MKKEKEKNILKLLGFSLYQRIIFDIQYHLYYKWEMMLEDFVYWLKQAYKRVRYRYDDRSYWDLSWEVINLYIYGLENLLEKKWWVPLTWKTSKWEVELYPKKWGSKSADVACKRYNKILSSHLKALKDFKEADENFNYSPKNVKEYEKKKAKMVKSLQELSLNYLWD